MIITLLKNYSRRLIDRNHLLVEQNLWLRKQKEEIAYNSFKKISQNGAFYFSQSILSDENRFLSVKRITRLPEG